MPAQLRAYITPEEYESAIAMSNKLQKQYWTADNNHVYALLLSGCSCIPCIIIHKCFCQISRRRIGEPFKQWERTAEGRLQPGEHWEQEQRLDSQRASCPLSNVVISDRAEPARAATSPRAGKELFYGELFCTPVSKRHMLQPRGSESRLLRGD